MASHCLSPRNSAPQNKRSRSESRWRSQERQHDRGNTARGRSSSAARSPRPYQAHTIESLNKCRSPKQDYNAERYKDRDGENETSFDAKYDFTQAAESTTYPKQKETGSHRYCFQQTDEEKILTADNFTTKLTDWLDDLKQAAKTIAILYNKETNGHTPQPPALKPTQMKRKTATRTPVRPLPSLSEEILHLEKHIDIIERAIQVLLEGQSRDQELMNILNEKIESFDAENMRLRSRQQNLKQKVDAMERRNHELVLEISLKNKEVTAYHAENRRLEEQKTDPDGLKVFKEKMTSLDAENARLKIRIDSAHQSCEKKQAKNEAEIQRLKNIIDKQTSKEKMLKYEVDTAKKECLKSQNRCKDCEGEVKKMEKTCREQREEINLKNQEISHLRTEIGMKSEQVKQTTVKIEIRRKEIAEANLLKKKNEKLCEENASLKEKIKAYDEEDVCLKRELERIKRQALERERELKRSANEKENHLKKLQEETKKKDRDINQMKVECKYINEVENNHKELEATLSQIYQKKDSEIASLQSDIYELTKQCETLKQKNDDYEGAIEELNVLREGYKNLKKEYHDQERRLQDEKRVKMEMTRKVEREIDRVGQLEIDLQTEKKNNDILRQEIVKTDSLHILNMEKEAQIMRLQYDNSTLHKSQKDLMSKIERLQANVDTVKEENGLINNALLEKEKEISVLNHKLRSLQSEDGIRKETEKQKQAVVLEQKNIQIELDQVKASREEMQKTLDHLRREKADKEKDYRNVEKKNREYEKEVKELRRQFKSLQDAIDDSKKESEKETHVLHKENKALQSELEQMKLRLHSDAEEMKYLMKENQDNKQLYLAAVNQVKEKEREITDLRRQCLGLEDVDKTVDHLRREKADKEKDYRNLEKKNRENEEKVRELRRQFKSLQEATNDNRKLSEKEVHVLHTENKSLQGELQQMKSSAQAMEKELDLVKREKADKEKDYKNVEKKNRENEEEVKELRKQLKRLRLDAEEMKSAMKENQDNKQLYLSSAKEVQEKERKIVDLQRQLSGFQDIEKKLDLVKRENADKEKDYRIVEKKNRENEEEVSELRRQLSSLQHRLDDQSIQTKAANENDVKLKASVENLQIENSSLQSELQELRSRLQQSNQYFELVKKEKMDTEQHYWHIEKDCKKKEQEIEELKREIHRTGEKLSKYEAVQKEKERIQQTASDLRHELQSKEQEIHSSREENSRLAYKLNAFEREADLLKKTFSHDESKGRILLEEKMKIEKELADVKSTVAQLTKERDDLYRDKDNADKKCVKMSKEIKDREDEAERLADKLATTEETLSALAEENTRLRRSQSHDLAGMNQTHQREIKSLQSELERVVSNFEERISMLNEENEKLRRSPEHSGEIIQKLDRQNTSLQSELERVVSNLDQLKRDYAEVKKEKDHALNRLSSVAGEKLRDNNPGIADLSDENRPINLGEKFSQLYDDQWTDAMENLEENLRFGETDGIRCLLNILKRVFDECVRISDDQFTQLKEITGTTNLPSDQLKKLKDLRKSTALQSVKNVKQLVNKTMSSIFSKEAVACQSYIDRSTELCWLMCVQDPPVVIDFTAVRGQEVNDKTFRKFTKTGSKIDFLVWPMIRLHRNGPLLQKGVVQPL